MSVWRGLGCLSVSFCDDAWICSLLPGRSVHVLNRGYWRCAYRKFDTIRPVDLWFFCSLDHHFICRPGAVARALELRREGSGFRMRLTGNIMSYGCNFYCICSALVDRILHLKNLLAFFKAEYHGLHSVSRWSGAVLRARPRRARLVRIVVTVSAVIMVRNDVLLGRSLLRGCNHV